MAIVTMFLVGMVFLGPLFWRIWLDRRRAEADAIGAEIRAAVNRRLRGESFLAVRVMPPSIWRPGRIVLSVPSGYEWLVEEAWPALARRIPVGYEVVLGAASRRAAQSSGERELARAA
jgi:hypothetical protein